MERFCAYEPTAAAGSCNTHLATEFVALVGLAFADALHLGGVHTVHLVLIVPLLLMNPPGNDQQGSEFWIGIRSSAECASTDLDQDACHSHTSPDYSKNINGLWLEFPMGS